MATSYYETAVVSHETQQERSGNERTHLLSIDTFGPKLTVRHDRSTSYEPGNLDAVLLRAGAQCSICGGSGNLIYRDPVKLLRSECVIGKGQREE